jgi:GGDEF domain-containing protein
VRAIREQLRSYDLIVRVGGDEFVCPLSGATLEEARRRFDSVRVTLAADPQPCEIKVGFADLAPKERAADVIERADANLRTADSPDRESGGRRAYSEAPAKRLAKRPLE